MVDFEQGSVCGFEPPDPKRWHFAALELAGLMLVIPPRFGDARGVFSETYNERVFAEHGIRTRFVQDNYSLSREAGTVRGLHFQTPPHAQAKLVRVLRGRIRDVAVDLRRGSPTYGQHVLVELSADNGRQLFVPEGFAHGFVTCEADTEVAYKVSDFYAPDHDAGIFWADSSLNIEWGIAEAEATISEKDSRLPSFNAFESPFSLPSEPLT